MKLFTLAHRHPPVRRLVDRALPLMDSFARNADQSYHLVIPDRDATIVVAHASPSGNWEFGIRIGATIDLLATGSGQTLLAFQGESGKAEMLARWSGTDRAKVYDRLAPMLAEFRSAGHRVGASQQIKGVDDFSVPVLAPDGDAVAVLTCPYIQRLDDAQASVADTLGLLKEIGTTLSFA
jgi:DNA-binding IclR family transcriptional regulator